MPECIQELWKQACKLGPGLKRAAQTALINRAIEKVEGQLKVTEDFLAGAPKRETAPTWGGRAFRCLIMSLWAAPGSGAVRGRMGAQQEEVSGQESHRQRGNILLFFIGSCWECCCPFCSFLL